MKATAPTLVAGLCSLRVMLASYTVSFSLRLPEKVGVWHAH